MIKKLFLSFFALFVFANYSFAAPGDTTYVTTFDEEFHNWADPHDSVFVFPNNDGKIFSKVTLYYTIACPYATPGADCDPWDRTGYINIWTDSTTYYEIARIITPYSINPQTTGGPGTCTWEIDVTEYQTMLTDSVTMRSRIESYIGGERGWLVTTEFEFIEAEIGETVSYPFKVENLWQNYYTVYGDPDNPIADKLTPQKRFIDATTDSVKMKIFTTGHGQQNTGNAAEFYNNAHYFFANGVMSIHNFWRYDCPQNTCSPQGGTWLYGRFGWCPGDKSHPYIWDVTSLITLGDTATLEYKPDLLIPYENACRPTNPNCISGLTCDNCDYGVGGHYEPIYAIQGQLIHYELVTVVEVEDEVNFVKAKEYELFENYPNPFNPETTIQFRIPKTEKVRLDIYNLKGQRIKTLANGNEFAKGTHSLKWNGTDGNGRFVSSGVYFYKLQTENFNKTNKMVLLK